MEKRIDDSRFLKAFAPEFTAIATVKAGETFTVRTLDCYGNSVSETGEIQNRTDGGNPSTGPIWVTGAEKGDTLAVHILKIAPAPFGRMRIRPGLGAMGEFVEKAQAETFPIRDGKIDFFGKLLPIDPMIGVIGVSTGGETIDTETPEKHGGNMDDRRITEGSTVYFPVMAEGAGLALGDVHALMGDGEVAICGMECAADVTVCCEVIKGRQENVPVVRDRNGCLRVNCSAKTLDEAAYAARRELLTFLEKRLPDHDRNRIILLMSLAGDLEITEIVDPLVTVRMGIRPEILPGLEF